MTTVIFITGILNILGVLLLFFSCRCIGGNYAARAMQWSWFRWFYKYHRWCRWLFFGSVAVHAVLALYVFGTPF